MEISRRIWTSYKALFYPMEPIGHFNGAPMGMEPCRRLLFRQGERLPTHGHVVAQEMQLCFPVRLMRTTARAHTRGPIRTERVPLPSSIPWETTPSTPSHYCPATFSGSQPNLLKIRPITHGQSRNDLNWKGAGLTSFRRSTG